MSTCNTKMIFFFNCNFKLLEYIKSFAKQKNEKKTKLKKCNPKDQILSLSLKLKFVSQFKIFLGDEFSALISNSSCFFYTDLGAAIPTTASAHRPPDQNGIAAIFSCCPQTKQPCCRRKERGVEFCCCVMNAGCAFWKTGAAEQIQISPRCVPLSRQWGEAGRRADPDQSTL